MTPQEEALIIREHCRLREQIMLLTTLNKNGHYYIRRHSILSLLHQTEPDKETSKIPTLLVD